MTVRDQVLAELARATLTTIGIAAALSISTSAVRRALLALVEAGDAEICGHQAAAPSARGPGGRPWTVYGITPAGRAKLAAMPQVQLAACQHKDFNASVRVNRLEDTGQFIADLGIACRHCGQPFEFVGMAPGLSFSGPAVSIDGTEAHLPLSPKGARPNPFQQMQHGVTRFNS